MTVGDIAALLDQRATLVCASVLAGGHREGHEWVEARRCDGGIGDSLPVDLNKHLWCHYASAGPNGRPRGGDMLELVAYVACGDDKKAAVAWAKSFLRLAGGAGLPRSASRPRNDAEQARREAEAAAAAERKRKAAVAMWLAGAPIKDTLAEIYLRSRGIDLRGLGRSPESLRFVPVLRHPEGRSWPAIVAAVTNLAGRHIATHRTFLRPDGRGKAPVANVKMLLGSPRGGCIRLWRGERIDVRTGEVKRGWSWRELESAAARGLLTAEDRRLVLCEGIEDGLTVAMGAPELRVAAVVNLPNLCSFEPPPPGDEIIWFADDDRGNAQALAALDRGITHLQRLGKRVRIARPYVVVPGAKDINAAVLKQRGAA